MKDFSPETLAEALDLWDRMGDLNKDGIRVLVEAARAGEALAEEIAAALKNREADFPSAIERIDAAVYAYQQDMGLEPGGPPLSLIDAALEPLLEPGVVVLEFDENGAHEVAPEPSYDIEIVDQGFEPGTYGGWTIQFKVAGLPRLSYQKSDPILDAFVKLERAAPDAPKLGSGGSTALARTDEKLVDAMMGGGAEGNVLRGFTGAAVTEVQPVVYGNAPIMPADERVAEACRASIKKHLAAVAEERKRLAVTDSSESVVGRKMKI